MTITRIKNIKEVENKAPTSESAFIQRTGSTDYYSTMTQIEDYLAVKTDAKIANEATARQEADNTLQSNIDSEVTARTNADSTLQTNIDNEAATRLANDNTLQVNIDNEASARSSADTTLQSNIDTEISDRKAAVSAEETARENADTGLQTQVTANKTAIDTLNGTGAGSVAKTVADKIAEVVADAPEDFDTLKEISDWISSHENDASAMNTAIQANKTSIETNTSDIASLKEADTTLQGNIDSEASARETADTALEKRTAANETDIAALKTADAALQANIDKKLDKTTDTANAGKVVAVEDDGSLGFKSVGISIDDTKASSETTYSSTKINTELAAKKNKGTKLTATVNASTSGSTVTISFNTNGSLLHKVVRVDGWLGVNNYPVGIFACEVLVAEFGSTAECALISHTNTVSSVSVAAVGTNSSNTFTFTLKLTCSAMGYSKGAAEAYLEDYAD